ncbi:hypothetical protein BC629DRAFT_1440567 [Irpex lacteus]|nr:hypothetical protein BC629DRAFT_1440567 [Irpex lacteus]
MQATTRTVLETRCRICNKANIHHTRYGYMLTCAYCQRNTHHRCIEPAVPDRHLAILLQAITASSRIPRVGRLNAWMCPLCRNRHPEAAKRTLIEMVLGSGNSDTFDDIEIIEHISHATIPGGSGPTGRSEAESTGISSTVTSFGQCCGWTIASKQGVMKSKLVQRYKGVNNVILGPGVSWYTF